jgi:atypical dual specificity phosphatase
MREEGADSTAQGQMLIRVRGLSAGYGDAAALRDVHFDVPRTGVFGLMGPSGAGKSTLLRALGRWNHSVPSFWTTGSVTCDEREILAQGSPAAARRLLPLLGQKARLYGSTVIDNLVADVPDHGTMQPWQLRAVAQAILGPVGLWEEFCPLLDAPALSLSMAAHKKLLIARLLSSAPPGLLADEPLTDISLAEEDSLLDFIRQVARSRVVLVVLHNKQQARRLCDWICLITGNRIAEVTPAAEFFVAPRTELGRQFLESGSCWPSAGDEETASPGASAVQPEVGRAAAIASAARTRVPPREFHWVIKDRLAGVQRPGLLGDVDDELARLAALGIKVLVSLTEDAFDAAKLAEFGIEGVHLSVPDMGVPPLPAAIDLCRRIAAWTEAGRPTALHCRAGLGRTGTLLAAALVFRGLDAVKAIERVRLVNPRYIQSDVQFQFVHQLAEALRPTTAA